MVPHELTGPDRVPGVLRSTVVTLALALLMVGCGGSKSAVDVPSSTTAPRTTTTARQPVGTAPTVVEMTTINPCTLFTEADASRLAGKPLTRAVGGGLGSGTCAYSGGKVLIGAELTVKVDTSAAAAHAEFRRWVQPVPNTAPGFSVVTVTKLGDEAMASRSSFTDGIYFRQGAVLVKIGVYPPASAAELKTAANTAADRL
jgi:hypothetical protein